MSDSDVHFCAAKSVKTEPEVQAEARADFIRRLFAVAVSVGFASTLSKMAWIQKEVLPNQAECGQLAILATGLVATVLSWDGYWMSINRKPLFSVWRYRIDILLVFLYMIFLMTSAPPFWWLPMLVAIFVLYFIWDTLTVREHLVKYDETLVEDGKRYASPADIAAVYWRGACNGRSTNRGPIVTFSWLIYFVGLSLLNGRSFRYQVFILAGLATVGLLFYRNDKIRKAADAYQKGYTMAVRALIIASLLLIGALCACSLRT
jgi:hypothetical protein